MNAMNIPDFFDPESVTCPHCGSSLSTPGSNLSGLVISMQAMCPCGLVLEVAAKGR